MPTETQPSPLKKPRGRPKGSSRHNRADDAAMNQIADILVRDPETPIAVAARQVGAVGESHERRLQRKWKADGARYLEEAYSRYSAEALKTSIEASVRIAQAVAVQISAALTSPGVQTALAHVAELGKVATGISARLQTAINTPEMRRAGEQLRAFEAKMNSPEMQKIAQQMQRIHERMNTPEMQKIARRVEELHARMGSFTAHNALVTETEPLSLMDGRLLLRRTGAS